MDAYYTIDGEVFLKEIYPFKRLFAIGQGFIYNSKTIIIERLIFVGGALHYYCRYPRKGIL